jgi:hypothetical protein
MAVTHKLIQTVTVGAGGAASVEFTSIPGTYTDLVLISSLRSVNGANDLLMTLAFNGSTSNFTSRYLYGNAPGGTGVSGSNSYFHGNVNGAGSTASIFTSTSLYIPNYTGSTNKSYSLDNTMENNSTASYPFLVAGLWSQTAAITSITITNASNFAQYSSASLYGISKS